MPHGRHKDHQRAGRRRGPDEDSSSPDRWMHKEERVEMDDSAAFNHSTHGSKRLKRGPREKTLCEQTDGEEVEGLEMEGGAKGEGDSGNKGRQWTLAIAVPASLLDGALTHEMKTYITGQIARTAAVFCVDEIVVYDDEANRKSDPSDTGKALHHRRNEKGSETSKRNTSLMAKILQYLECPQYLRSYFFPLHDDLKSVGLLNPLDAPHHLRSHEKCLYREGVVVPATADKDKERAGRNAKGTKQCPVLSLVNVGLKKNAIVHAILEPQLRVTVKFRRVHEDESEALHGDPVPPHTPRVASGLYWGYDVRVADTFSAVFSQSPHDDGYDLSIGISPNGQPLGDQSALPPFRHAIVVFAGPERDGMERVLNEEPKLEVKDPRDLFDLYVKPLNDGISGGGHIRTEESLLISLSALRPKLVPAGQNQ